MEFRRKRDSGQRKHASTGLIFTYQRTKAAAGQKTAYFLEASVTWIDRDLRNALLRCGVFRGTSLYYGARSIWPGSTSFLRVQTVAVLKSTPLCLLDRDQDQ